MLSFNINLNAPSPNRPYLAPLYFAKILQDFRYAQTVIRHGRKKDDRQSKNGTIIRKGRRERNGEGD